MKIAFYAPLKPLSSPHPSGDRLIGRLLKSALEQAGHEVQIASTFRSYEGKGDKTRQGRLQAVGQKMAERVVKRLRSSPPDLWFTYHLYRKAPDWLGPEVCRQFTIPYVVAEASFAPAQHNGAWAAGHQAVAKALSQVNLAFGTTAADEPCLIPQLAANAHYLRLSPFLDTTAFAPAPSARAATRQQYARSAPGDENVPWLLTVAMMRPGVKFESYEVLAKALRLCLPRPWRLMVVGGGPQFQPVKALFADMEKRIAWLGPRTAPEIAALYAASDIYVWPSVRESPGMTFLEAQASGLPVVGGDGGGVADVIKNGVGGFLTEKRNHRDFADQVNKLLDDPRLRTEMGHQAIAYVTANHTLTAAATRLNEGLALISS